MTVGPTGNSVGALLVMVNPQLSDAVGGVSWTCAPVQPVLLATTVIVGGQEMTGDSVSFTSTVTEQVLVLLAPSVAVNVKVVTPTGKILPDSCPP
jgi:hypothetical protein